MRELINYGAMSRWRSCLVNATLAVGSFLLVLTAAEVVLRLTGATEAYVPRPERPAAYEYHEVLGYRMTPNLRNEPFHGFDWGIATYSTNSLGWRAPEVPPEKPRGVKRVFLVGDSIVAGMEVNDEDHMAHHLQTLLGEGYEVINAATRGYGTTQEALLTERFVMPRQPDAVILVVVPNDFGDNITVAVRGKPAKRPVFRLDGNGNLIDPELPVKDYPPTAQAYLKNASQLVVEEKSAWWLKRRHLQSTLQRWRRRLALHRFVSMASGGWQRAHEGPGADLISPYFTQLLYTHTPPGDSETQARTRLLCALLQRLDRGLQQQGTLFLASAYMGDYQYQVGHHAVEGLDKDTLDPLAMEQYLARECLGDPARWASLYPAFKPAWDKGAPLYYPNDKHLAPGGHRLAAEVFHKALKDAGL